MSEVSVGDIVTIVECPYCTEERLHKHSYENEYVILGYLYRVVAIESHNEFCFEDLKTGFVTWVAGQYYSAKVSPVDVALWRKGKWNPEKMLDKYRICGL